MNDATKSRLITSVNAQCTSNDPVNVVAVISVRSGNENAIKFDEYSATKKNENSAMIIDAA